MIRKDILLSYLMSIIDIPQIFTRISNELNTLQVLDEVIVAHGHNPYSDEN